jgi:hypothetical protein
MKERCNKWHHGRFLSYPSTMLRPSSRFFRNYQLIPIKLRYGIGRLHETPLNMLQSKELHICIWDAPSYVALTDVLTERSRWLAQLSQANAGQYFKQPPSRFLSNHHSWSRFHPIRCNSCSKNSVAIRSILTRDEDPSLTCFSVYVF